MKKAFYLYTALLFAALGGGVSCMTQDVEVPDREIVFTIYDTEDKPVENVRVALGDALSYRLDMRYVTSLKIAEPAGWTCRFYGGNPGQAVFKAPVLDDPNAELSGEVVVEMESAWGRKSTRTIAVSAFERDVTLNPLDDLSEPQVLAFGASAGYRFSTSNVVSVEATVPRGWSYTWDSESEPGTLTLTAPKDGNGAEPTGQVTVTPLSARGTKGEACTFEVQASDDFPELVFSGEEAVFTAFGQQRAIAFTGKNLENVTVRSLPEGWSATADLPGSRMSVTAPAQNDLRAYGNGTLVVTITGTIGEPVDVSLPLRVELPQGIASDLDFEAFGQAVAAGEPISRWQVDGRVKLMLNVDLSGSDHSVFVGSAERPFVSAFDGNGRTIRIDIASGVDDRALGLFHTVAAPAVIRDLHIEGRLLLRTEGNATAVNAGGVAAIASGARFEGISADLLFEVAPEVFTKWSRSGANSTEYAKYSGGALIIGRLTGAPSAFVDCTSDGVYRQTKGSLTGGGGIVGLVEVDGSTFDGCVNNADIELLYDSPTAADDAANCCYGGIVGDSQQFTNTLSDCKNYGKVSISFSASSNGNLVLCMGGIAGSTYGSVERCENHGEISDAGAAKLVARRMGGIVGGVTGGAPALVKEIRIRQCTNYGAIRNSNNYSGGIVGVFQQFKYGEIVECVNEGVIESVELADIGDKNCPGGAITAMFRGDLMKDCVNNARIFGYIRRLHGGGLMNTSQSYATPGSPAQECLIENCVNNGDIDFYQNAATAGIAAMEVCVAGVGVIHNGNMKFVNCRNTGKLYVDRLLGAPDKKVVYNTVSRRSDATAAYTLNAQLDAATRADNALTANIVTER